MTTLGEIEVHVEKQHGNVRPILNEVLHALDRLIDEDEPTAIDLASLPFAPGELAALEAALGTGEISATLDALGTSPARTSSAVTSSARIRLARSSASGPGG